MIRLAYHFADAELRERALTHRSVGAGNNERLEFFGDALVNLIVAELLFDEFPKAAEGELTRLRARLVSEPALAAIARELELGDALHLGPGELKSGGFRRDSILADAFEALVAAVYLDGGWSACREVVRKLVAPRLAEAAAMDDKDAKTRLQEWLQSRGEPLPSYELVATTGADHARIFDVECRIESRDLRAEGRGSSRRAAEQAAATAVLALLQSA
ncbi:MAG: ribonuclease III [Rudaea sp.]|uniref:ribonuclease III n=1 Tax=unclassified Rudaea TaxID=2627037 RepID=UPI0010F579A3|nr:MULTISPECIES: ribonuclease III [unclassified Rudaea]MBN8884678.1 ribonuclease III [Rudaea sp.]